MVIISGILDLLSKMKVQSMSNKFKCFNTRISVAFGFGFFCLFIFGITEYQLLSCLDALCNYMDCRRLGSYIHED